MLSFLGTVLVALITGAFVWLGRRVDAAATREIAERQQQLDQHKVSREDFTSVTNELHRLLENANTRVQESEDRRREQATEFDGVVKRLNEKIDKLRDDLEDEREKRQDSDDRAEQADRRADTATREVAILRQRVAQLEDVMRKEGINIPPPLPPPLHSSEIRV